MTLVATALRDQGGTFALDAHIVAAVWLGERLALALGDGRVVLLAVAPGACRVAREVQAHEGTILGAVPHPDGRAILTGGDDGRLMRLGIDGELTNLLDTGGRWVHELAASPVSGLVAAAVAREAIVFRPGQEPHRFGHPTTAGGLAFDPKGRRLAVSHYGGVALWWAMLPASERTPLAWKGSHLNTVWSPDGRHLVTAMQENELHGWRLPEGQHMRMSGYLAKSRSLSWSWKGRWLLTSGADRVIGWPFGGRTGPMGKRPLELGPAGTPVTRVAAHPRQELAAAGYADGAVRLLRLGDGADLPLAPRGDGAVTALAWSPNGAALAWGKEGGAAGIFFPARDMA